MTKSVGTGGADDRDLAALDDGQVGVSVVEQLGHFGFSPWCAGVASHRMSATKLYRKDTPSAAFAEFRLANKDNIETARGIHMHNNFVLVDEATGVPDEIFQVLGNIFPDPNPKLCLISISLTTEMLAWRQIPFRSS